MKTKSIIALMKSVLSRTVTTLMIILVLSVTVCRMMDISLPSQITTLYNYAPIGMIVLITGTILFKMIGAIAFSIKSRFSSLPE